MKEIKYRQKLKPRFKGFNDSGFHYWGYIEDGFVSPLGKVEAIGESEQYIGTIDNNGVEIFEGDIVDHAGIGVGFVEYRNSKAAFKIVFAGTIRKWFIDVLDSELKLIEVIGNIHDNPELLERAE